MRWSPITLMMSLVVLAAAGCRGPAPVSDGGGGEGGPPEPSIGSLVKPTGTSTINWDAALTAAMICNASYKEPGEEEQDLRDLGFKQIAAVSEGSVHAVVCSDDSVQVVAFRGTDDLRDWLLNLDMRRKKVPHGQMHEGFHRGTNLLLEKIHAATREQGGQSKQVCVTGHSLGGAMAVAFAYDAIEKLDIVSLITFGQPLLLNRPLARHVNGSFGWRYRRFVNGSDVVTRVPPTFFHAGSRVHFSGDGTSVFEPVLSLRAVGPESKDDPKATSEEGDPEAMTVEEFERLQQQLREELRLEAAAPKGAVTRGRITWLDDHSMEIYQERIKSHGGSE